LNAELQDFLIYRLLLALPFPAFIARESEAVAKSLGAIFDTAQVLPRYASKPANILLRWATKWIWAIADARLEVLPPGYYPIPERKKKKKSKKKRDEKKHIENKNKKERSENKK
jgi:hypothetical protein